MHNFAGTLCIVNSFVYLQRQTDDDCFDRVPVSH